MNLKLTGEDKTFVCEMEVPNDNIAKFEKSINDGSLAVEVDKIHGMDPVLNNGKKDVSYEHAEFLLSKSTRNNLG